MWINNLFWDILHFNGKVCMTINKKINIFFYPLLTIQINIFGLLISQTFKIMYFILQVSFSVRNIVISFFWISVILFYIQLFKRTIKVMMFTHLTFYCWLMSTRNLPDVYSWYILIYICFHFVTTLLSNL